MARTIKQIKKSMTDQFMADQVIRDRYGLTGRESFESAFSAVSVESIIFGIVAAAVYVLETMFEAFRTEIERKITSAVVASIPWYHKVCLEYQHGDSLVLDESTFEYVYPAVDASKRKVKFASCRDRGGGIYILVAGEDAEGNPTALSNDVLTAFREYVNRRKPAGVIAEVYSYDPDTVRIRMTVQYDPIVMNSDGSLISDPSVFPVEDAVNGYLSGIIYGGTFNKNRMIDAVQAAEGVKDLVLDEVLAKPVDAQSYAAVVGNNYKSVGGSFRSSDLKATISYVLEI